MAISDITNLSELVLEGGLGIGTTASATFGSSTSVLVSGGSQLAPLRWVEGSSAISIPTTVSSLNVLAGLSVGSSAVITGALTQSGAATFSSTVAVAGALTQVGAATFSSTVAVAGALTQVGAATFSSTVAVAGALTQVGAATFSSTVSIAGVSTHVGASTFSSTVSIAGALTQVGAATFSSTVAVTGALTQIGAATFSSTVNIRGSVSFNNATVAQTADVAGIVLSKIINTNNNSTSTLALMDIQVGGTAAGSAFIRTSDGSTFWSAGSRVALANRYAVAQSTALTGTNEFLSITTGGVVTIGASASVQTQIICGVQLQLQANTTSTQFQIRRESTDGSISISGNTGAASGGELIVYGHAHATKADLIEFQNNSGLNGIISAAGKWTIGASGSPQRHVLNATSATNGAVALTLLNGPTGTTGSPTKWVQIDINGTTGVFPVWGGA